MTTSSASPVPADVSAVTPAILLESPATAPASIMTSETVAQLEKLSLEEEGTESTTTAAVEEQDQVINTEMLSAPTAVPTPSPSQVFAPRPIRAPFPGLYRPIPQRLPKPMLVQLDESPMARSPSPVITHTQHRRSSSATSTLAPGESRWNAVKMLESRLTAGETTEADEATEGSNGDANNVLFYSSPSKDVLDELYKIMRSNKAYPFSNFRELSATSPSPSFYRNRTPTKTPSSPSQHRRKISDAATPDSQLIARSPNPEREWNKIVFPSSPISRTTMRNPILYNSQFGTVSAE